MIREVALALGLTLFSGSTAWAIPQTLNFQGLLKESGSPVNDTRQMTFKIWDSPSGGSAVFTEPASGSTNVIVSTGVFSFTIGSITSGGIPLSVFDGSDRYVEVVVGTTTLPRQKITSVGNAFIAATAVNLSTSATIQISSISASSATFTAVGSDQYSLKTSSGIMVSSGGVAAPFFSGSFVGDGSGLTGLVGADSTKVAKTGDTMTGQLTLSGSTLTVTGSGFSVGGTTLAVVGGRVGVGMAAPATSLDVNGSAQFGSGSAKSTFTATAGGSTYALQLSSGVSIANGGTINLSAGGYIKFNDGTTMTSTATLSSGGGSSNSWVEFATAAISAVTSYTFSNLVPGASWRLEYTLTQNTSNAQWYLRFNGDATSGRYRHASKWIADNANEPYVASGSDAECELTDDVDNVTAGRGGFGWITFTTQPGASRVFLRHENTYLASTNYTESGAGGCWYDAVTDLASVNFDRTAGTITGVLKLFKRDD